MLVLLGGGTYIAVINLQEQIDETNCIMGGSCPEVNSILADKIDEVLERDNLKLSCKEYQQEEVLRWNITCNITGTDFYMDEYSYIKSELSEEKRDCGWYQTISQEAVIIKINNECLRYEIVKN